MAQNQKPIRTEKNRKTARVTFTAPPDLLRWARAEAKRHDRTFANWLTWRLGLMRKGIKPSVTTEDDPPTFNSEESSEDDSPGGGGRKS